MNLKKTAVAPLVALFLLVGATGTPAQAATVTYNKSATAIAKSIKCKNHRNKSGKGHYSKSSLVCDLKGKRVNVITFRNESSQTDWLKDVRHAFDSTAYVGAAPGVVIVAKNGNRSAARVGAKAVSGIVVPITPAW